jgi:hypothetical protein
LCRFNLFTFNSRIFPGTAPLLARPGERVRIRGGIMVGSVSEKSGAKMIPIHAVLKNRRPPCL